MFRSKKPKKYSLSPDKIVRLIDSQEGCIATDRITVDGRKVGFMYRDQPYENGPDSGWRFMAGDEDQEYMGNPDNHGVYQVNTVCNCDPDIIPFLDSPPGTAYIRAEDGKFILDEEWENPDD